MCSDYYLGDGENFASLSAAHKKTGPNVHTAQMNKTGTNCVHLLGCPSEIIG